MARRRDEESARALGFESVAEERRFGRRVRSLNDFNALPRLARYRREDALAVVALMRREGLDLGSAAARYFIEPHAVRWWAFDAFDPAGELRPADRLWRPMKVPSGGEVVRVEVRDSRVASDIGAYWSAVGAYLNYGDESVGDFEGFAPGGRVVETDLDVLDEMARRGLLSLDAIYVLGDR